MEQFPCEGLLGAGGGSGELPEIFNICCDWSTKNR